ncbi:PRC-barrel domain-containing protein [Paeniglutamicibacter sp. NPDC091659]|uniref:PRC-barrel domain-containing protein n=1 Tax=Paeniglutamicibacter sp. NPDC091659 TaxID=3364389 RepID=UPI0037FF5032
MLRREELHKLLETATTVVGPTGEKIGTLGHLLLDARTGEPGFATIHTGFFGTAESIVPLSGATISRGILHVAFDKDVVRHAPNIDPLAELGIADEDRLFEYYGPEPPEPAGRSHGAHAADPAAAPARATRPSGFETDERVIAVDDDEGRPLLRKYVVTASETTPPKAPGATHGRHAAPPER